MISKGQITELFLQHMEPSHDSFERAMRRIESNVQAALQSKNDVAKITKVMFELDKHMGADIHNFFLEQFKLDAKYNMKRKKSLKSLALVG